MWIRFKAVLINLSQVVSIRKYQAGHLSSEQARKAFTGPYAQEAEVIVLSTGLARRPTDDDILVPADSPEGHALEAFLASDAVEVLDVEGPPDKKGGPARTAAARKGARADG